MKSCFMCGRRLGDTFGKIGDVDMCLPCHGRVTGFVMRATEPLIAVLREVEFASGDDLGPPGGLCPVCHTGGGDRNPRSFVAPSPHANDCALAIAIGAPREEATD